MTTGNQGGTNLHRVATTSDLGKSLLVGSPGLTIPMPAGATPPAAPASSGQGSEATQSGSGPGNQSGESNG